MSQAETRPAASENGRKFPISVSNSRKYAPSGRIPKNRRNADAPEVGLESSEPMDIMEEIVSSNPFAADGPKRPKSAPRGVRPGRTQKRWIPLEDHRVTRQKAFTRTERGNGPKTRGVNNNALYCNICIECSITGTGRVQYIRQGFCFLKPNENRFRRNPSRSAAYR